MDANVLFLPGTAGLAIDAEVRRWDPGAEIWVPSSVLGELDRLGERRTPGARLARELARRYPVARVAGRGDAALLRAAKSLRAWVVTADRELRRRLGAAGVPTLVPREHDRLVPIPPTLAPRRATVKNRPPLERPTSSRGRSHARRRPPPRSTRPRVR